MEDNKDAIRLNTVRRVDPHVVTIVDSSSGTALYTYDEGLARWSKTDIEGTLMVYTREAPPHNMVTIINRKSKSNFIESITPSCELETKPPFLLLKNGKGSIFCIWFRLAEDVSRISDAINEKITNPSIPNILDDPAIAAHSGGGDIMAMLSKAHGEFSGKSDSVSSPRVEVVRPAPIKGETAATNPVADFLAKVGNLNTGSGATPNTSQPIQKDSNTVLTQMFQGAAYQSRIGQPANPATPIQIPAKPAMDSVASLGMSLEELEGKLKGSLSISKESSCLLQTLEPHSTGQDTTSLLSPQTFTMTTNKNLLTPLLDHKNLCGSEESLTENLNFQQEPAALVSPLTQDQFVQAFKILLNRNDFAKQLHQAYLQVLGSSS